uniref:Ankyrin repeat domain-containing protein 13C-like n=1 Tax=Sinocyclocheilus rhinocerous TaxID=307959 RepID=A0A673JP06_9TELE
MTGEKIRSVRKERKAGLDLLEPDEEPAATGPTKANRGSKILSGGNHKILRSSSQQNQNHGDTDGAYPVHECVFRGDVRRLSSLIRTQNIAQKDLHGNTPLHLAVMMGHKECAHLLLAHNAPVKVKNAQGWSPLAEAISYGDRQMITALLRKLKQQSRESVEDKRPRLLKALKELGDFYLELHWDFQSWVPLLSRILPSDACKIYKQGINIRYVSRPLVTFPQERVGNFLADFYMVNGLVLESRKRREHLSEEDILRNKAIMESFSKGGGSIIEQSFEPVRRQSLTAPSPNTISWEEYITAETGKAPHLGRELVCKESKKNFKATVAMSQDFPLSIESLLNVLEVIAPFKHFNKLREFVQMKLPPGFPVKLDIPVFPTITATVTFQEFRYDEFDDSIFTIPNDYKEDPSRFPDL